MKIYTLSRKQFLPISLQESWEFFSSPKNLVRITPASMNFRVEYISGGDKMYPGQVIRYKVRVLPLITVTWVTEITQVQQPYFFIDEQRFGPYSWWHHQHHFKEVSGGVEVIDEVNYALPLGWLGRLGNSILVKAQLNAIFDYRFKVVNQIFNNPKVLKQV